MSILPMIFVHDNVHECSLVKSDLRLVVSCCIISNSVEGYMSTWGFQVVNYGLLGSLVPSNCLLYCISVMLCVYIYTFL